jgi:hypothetical protein
MIVAAPTYFKKFLLEISLDIGYLLDAKKVNKSTVGISPGQAILMDESFTPFLRLSAPPSPIGLQGFD